MVDEATAVEALVGMAATEAIRDADVAEGAIHHPLHDHGLSRQGQLQPLHNALLFLRLGRHGTRSRNAREGDEADHQGSGRTLQECGQHGCRRLHSMVFRGAQCSLAPTGSYTLPE